MNKMRTNFLNTLKLSTKAANIISTNKILTTAIGLFMATCNLQAQTPQSICYQGVATDAVGIELQARTINIRTTILSDAPSGTTEWTETHQVQTDDFGLFNLNIGEGTPTGGASTAFSTIEWGEHAFFLRVEMDENGGTDYKLMGISQMMSVPYALYSKGADQANVAQTAIVADSAAVAQFAYSALNDEDTSPTNEIQTLSFDEGTGELTLSGSNAVVLSGGLNNTDEQNAAQVDVVNGSFTGQTVEEALDNINASLAADEDTDATNELQNAEAVNVTTGTFSGQTVNEALEAIHSGLGDADGDGDATNEIQDATEVDIENGTFDGQNVQQALENINFALEADEDSDATNELQEANEINVTAGNYNGQTVEEALGNVNSEVTTITTQLTQVVNEIAADADGDATNEIQQLVYDGETLGITGGNTITLGDVVFSAPGASIIYPQGILGDYIVVTDANYEVPAGKNFYMTGGPPVVNLTVNGTSYAHKTTPNMPVLQEGQAIENCNCLGLLIDENGIVDVEIIDFQNASTYTVPTGKVFVVKSGMVNDDVSYLVVNNVQIEFFRPSLLRSSNLLSFPAGTSLQMPNNVSEMVLTGYLIELE